MEASNTPPSAFSLLLKKVKDKELHEFVASYGQLSEEFQTEFLLRFANLLPFSGKEKYKLLVQKVLLPGKEDETNSIEADTKIFERVKTLLQKANDQLAQKNYLDPYFLAVTVIEELYQVISQTDPLVEDLQNLISDAFDILDNILHTEAGPDLKEMIFETAITEAARPYSFNTGTERNWFTILLDAATDEEKQGRALKLLDQQVNKSGRQVKEPVHENNQEFLLRKKIALLEQMGRKDAARKVIEENLRIKSFRRQLIDEAISKKDFSTAKELIRESKLSDQQKGRLYVSGEWDELLLKIAQMENDLPNIRNTGLRLFYDRYDIRFYRVVKQTFPSEKWSQESEQVIDNIRNEKYFGVKGMHAMAAIYIEEQQWLRLLQLMQKNASLEFVEAYYALLKDKFPVELVDIYREALRRYAEHNMGREHYEYLVQTLRKIQSLPSGIDASRSLATEFKVKYRQRRNMVKALNKLVF
jgi:hypothetical protein